MGSDEQAIRDLFAAWLEASRSGDITRVLALMTDDVVFLVPGRPPFGRDAFAAAFGAGGRQHRAEGTAELEEIVVAGEVAYARARLAISITPIAGGTPTRLAGYTLTVYRKQSDGHWLLARDANLLGPAPAEPV